MSKHLATEIERLKKRLLYLSGLVEENFLLSVQAIVERDADLAATVIEGDSKIDQTEVDLEEDCLKALALHQPVAIDLRVIIAILKINNDLERVGDLAVNIAERAAYLSVHDTVRMPADLPRMAAKTRDMLKQALDALVEEDIERANAVCAADDEVDGYNRAMYRQLEESVREQPDNLTCLMQLYAVARHLERIADHATNIAEDVIYMFTGDIIRHSGDAGAVPPLQT